MNYILVGGLALAVCVGGYAFLGQSSNTSPDYERSEIFAKCDTDYLQSARHLGFRASAGECECFDDKLQQLTATQRRAAYKSLEDRLTLAFMGKAGAQVDGTNVTYDDGDLGRVSANVAVETSGTAIMQQCSMF